MTHKAIYSGNPPYLTDLVQWHTPCRTLRSACANLLSVARCNISFGARGFRSAAPAIWNSPPSNVRSCKTLTTFRRHLKSHLSHSLVTHLSTSDSFTMMALYISIYLPTYFTACTHHNTTVKMHGKDRVRQQSR